jgi:hypothetical protein
MRTLFRGDLPMPRLVVPCGGLHVLPETYVRENAELARAALQITPDFGLRRKTAGPGGFERKRVGVEMRFDVARATRVGVVTPSAADVLGSFEHDKIGVTGALQPDGRAEPTEAAADDRNVMVSHRRCAILARGGHVPATERAI